MSEPNHPGCNPRLYHTISQKHNKFVLFHVKDNLGNGAHVWDVKQTQVLCIVLLKHQEVS
jgi:hypothetical protein